MKDYREEEVTGSMAFVVDVVVNSLVHTDYVAITSAPSRRDAAAC